MFSRLWVAVVVSLMAHTLAGGAEPEKKFRADDGALGYALFPGTTSPDGAYSLAFRPAGWKPQARAGLTEYPANVSIPGGDVRFDNFLFDTRRKRVVGRLPDIDSVDGRGFHVRGDLEVAWTPDSRHALAIRKEGRKDTAIAWIDPAAGKCPSVQEQMEDAFGRFLHGQDRTPYGRYLHFQDPVALGSEVLVVDAWEQWPMRAPMNEYLLKMRFTAGQGGAARCTILAGRRHDDEGQPEWLEDAEVMEKYYRTLRATLPLAAQTALDQEQGQWTTWSRAQPKDAQATLVSQRTALLRARLEFP